MCIIEGCRKRASYNFEGLKAEFCGDHRQINMINVVSKKCIYEGCKTTPSFNFGLEKLGLYCAKHKLEGMIDIKHKKCIHESCKIQPAFNYEHEIIAIYCSKHKLEGMIDIKHKKCIYENCKISPSFNYEHEAIAIYCLKHKLEGMIDVISKRCIYEDCKTGPTFNYEHEKTAIYCSKHKLEGMIDIKHKRCLTPLCYTRITNKYRGYCLYCFVNLFPEEKNARNYKTKERAVVEYILERFSDYTWVVNKKVADGCSRRCPDLYLDLGYQVVIIEIDENQHEEYDCSCENMRMMQLSQDVDHRPLVFIRFNPDGYLKDGVNITSCWANDFTGICKVKKCKIEEWAFRLKTLQEQLSYWITPDNITEKTVEVIQLFYDC